MRKFEIFVAIMVIASALAIASNCFAFEDDAKATMPTIPDKAFWSLTQVPGGIRIEAFVVSEVKAKGAQINLSRISLHAPYPISENAIEMRGMVKHKNDYVKINADGMRLITLRGPLEDFLRILTNDRARHLDICGYFASDTVFIVREIGLIPLE